jgi:hypothetical protein
MKRKSVVCSVFLLCLGCLLYGTGHSIAGQIQSPRTYIGHEVGADYKLARYERIRNYFKHVGENSQRVNVRGIGLTTEGREMVIAAITEDASPQAIQKVIAAQKKVSDPRLIRSQEQEKKLIARAKVIVLINCNLHSTEIASSQMAMELLYDLATGTSSEIAEILKRTVIILIPSANPDGLNKVIDWYDRSLGKPWEGTGMPWLYQKYAGHDNNRDWFMLNLKETRLVSEVIYEQWLPNVVYDIHQMGNSGARFFVPPFFDPKNPNVHPLNDHMMLIIGGHMAAELTRAGKKGILNSAMYDNWWQGGFRTTAYRHNIVGILTEAASVLIASPVFQRKSELRGTSRGMPDYAIATNFPDPWPGGWWRLRDIVDYEKIACMSLFSLAAKYHELFVSNKIKLGRDATERGRTEPPFAWLVPPDQHDIRSAVEMLSILHAAGIEVHLAQEEFTADNVYYPAGTYILFCSQPYRSHLNDMMERQEYPNRSYYQGGPPEAPYDMAGWTLPLQMGVRCVSVSQPFESQTRRLDVLTIPQGNITKSSQEIGGYIVKAGSNDNYRLINRLFRADIPFKIVSSPRQWNDMTRMELPYGSIFIPDVSNVFTKASTVIEGISTDLLPVPQQLARIKAACSNIQVPSLALYQPWTASKDEGWTRLVLDSFEFDYSSIHNAEIRAGKLKDRYDCLVLPSIGPRSIINGRAADTTGPQYVGGIGDEGIINLQDFVREGGSLICIDNASNLPIQYFNIPVRNIIKNKSSKEFFCPGSILRVWVDNKHPVGYGTPQWISGYFARSQAFELTEESNRDNPRNPEVRFPARVVARYSDTVLLESGWIRGKEHIIDKPAIVEVQYGKGKIVLFGFRVQHRGQTHGTFRLLFNAILNSAISKS